MRRARTDTRQPVAKKARYPRFDPQANGVDPNAAHMRFNEERAEDAQRFDERTSLRGNR